ncbi:MAG: response regulator receiver protein [Acidimicrobiales bacterium]|nr:response regulator receiver protein [Acidimicrobiales bacterium]
MGHVLVADDQEDVRSLLTLVLQLEGHDVATAVDGADAVTKATESPPDAIILDVMMPRVDGLTALRQLRRAPLTAHVPVLLLSGKTSAADVDAGMDAGADGYLAKPFDLDDLVAAVAEMTHTG